MATNILPDFDQALKAAGLADFFRACTGPHQNEYLRWLNEAKRAETRRTRVTKAVQMLAAKRADEEKRASKKDGKRNRRV